MQLLFNFRMNIEQALLNFQIPSGQHNDPVKKPAGGGGGEQQPSHGRWGGGQEGRVPHVGTPREQDTPLTGT